MEQPDFDAIFEALSRDFNAMFVSWLRDFDDRHDELTILLDVLLRGQGIDPVSGRVLGQRSNLKT